MLERAGGESGIRNGECSLFGTTSVWKLLPEMIASSAFKCYSCISAHLHVKTPCSANVLSTLCMTLIRGNTAEICLGLEKIRIAEEAVTDYSIGGAD